MESMHAVQPKKYIASDHAINVDLIDPDALFVIDRLRQNGHEAYIVGGSIRDLLAGSTPKDFDISTSALPEEIKKIFGRRCILIGRRFRLAHIRFGSKVLEVATFRAGDNTDGDLIVRDNEWGTAEEDVLRRDFTINGLLYDPEEHAIIDYIGGWEDIHNRLLRTIGDPVVRFRQDPVRMIRLLKFVARFDFHICPEAEKALEVCRSELTKSSPARVLEELLRMLESGFAADFIELLDIWHILEILLPDLTTFLESDLGDRIYDLLEVADEMNLKEGYRPLDRSVLASCLLYPVLEHEVKEQFLSKGLTPNMGEILMVANGLIRGFVTSSFSHFPRRLSTTMGYILATQYRLTPLSGKRHPKHKVMRSSDFKLALQFLKIRAHLDEELMPVYTSWRELQRQDEGNAPPPPPKRKRRPRRR